MNKTETNDEKLQASVRLEQAVAQRGVTCTLRVASDALERLAADLKGLAGKASSAALITQERQSLEPYSLDEVAKTFTSAGFAVHTIEIPQTEEGSLDALSFCATQLAKAHITRDDVLCGVGCGRLSSVIGALSASWCDTCSAGFLATTPSSCITASAFPQPLSAMSETKEGYPALFFQHRIECVSAVPAVFENLAASQKNLLCALAVKAAICDSADAVSELVLNSQELSPSQKQSYANLAVAAARSAGRVRSAQLAAQRYSLWYGSEFARALASLQRHADAGVCLAEGMRFSSRLAVSALGCDIELVEIQDGLLERFSIPSIEGLFEADSLFKALLDAIHQTRRQMLMALPYGEGRVRLMPVSEDLLREHVYAWCAAR